MIVSFFIYSVTTDELLAGVTPSFDYYKRRNEDGTITDLADPTISGTGGGRYEFEIDDDDLIAGSAIDYVIDCTAASATPRLEGHVDGDEVIAESSEQTGSGVLTFGVTSSTLRRHCFPRIEDFSSTSSPTSTTVTEKIEVAAARVAAGLSKESISPSSILTETAGYAICADIIRKMAALELRIPCDDPETPKGWKADIDEFFKLLAKDAGIALADVSLTGADSPPNGPTTHLTEYDLEIDSESDMSDATFPLHAKDAM
jgi:hypothetical protein